MKKQYYFLLIIGILVADFATKSWIVQHLALSNGWAVNEFINIVRVHNSGAAFGFLSNQNGWQVIFLSTLALVVSVVIAYYLIKTPLKQTFLLLSLSLIVCGALGNTIDRFIYGFVIDFIDVHYQGYHWPAFNIADTVISLGAFFFILDNIKSGKDSKT